MPTTLTEPSDTGVSGPGTALEIKLNGATYADPAAVPVRADVETNLRMPAMATLQFNDDDFHKKAKDFTLGAKVEISFAGVGNEEKPLAFKGEVVALEAYREALQGVTVVRCYDDLSKLYGARKTKTYLHVKYGDIVRQVAQANGVAVGTIDTAGPVLDYVIQHEETDGEFLERLAAECGYLVHLDNDWKLTFAPPATLNGTTTIPSSARAGNKELVLGDDLVNYEITFGPKLPAANVKTFGWDIDGKEAAQGESQVSDGSALVKFKNLTPPTPDGDFLLSSIPFRTTAAAQHAAKGVAHQIQAEFATLRGWVRSGNPFINAGDEIAVGPPDSSFAGWYRITSARHTFADGSLRTEVLCNGLGDRGLAAGARNGAQPSASAPTNTAPWLVTGLVTDVSDPEGKMGRVKVRFPTLNIDGDATSDWLRVVGSGNGDERGTWWLPEVGDEVVVAFEQGDMRTGYVLGGVHNGRDLPEFGGDPVYGRGSPRKRGFTTTSGHQLMFTDDPDAPGIELHSGDRSYVMKFDQKSTAFTIDVDGGALLVKLEKDNGITIQSNKQITVESKQGDLTLKGQNVALEASAGDVTIKGINVKADAQANFEAKGTAGAKVTGSGPVEVSSSAITTVKGSLVQIN